MLNPPSPLYKVFDRRALSKNKGGQILKGTAAYLSTKIFMFACVDYWACVWDPLIGFKGSAGLAH